MANDLVSVIMLSKDKGRYVAESVGSILTQTYTNWELIFVDDSKDDTINLMMDLMGEGKRRKKDGTAVNRISVTRNMHRKGSTA